MAVSLSKKLNSMLSFSYLIIFSELLSRSKSRLLKFKKMKVTKKLIGFPCLIMALCFFFTGQITAQNLNPPSYLRYEWKRTGNIGEGWNEYEIGGTQRCKLYLKCGKIVNATYDWEVGEVIQNSFRVGYQKSTPTPFLNPPIEAVGTIRARVRIRRGNQVSVWKEITFNAPGDCFID
ncbi:MAG TPA: hypothetical protein ENJ95_12390 [Bacteroidetes bacterium]|nr:hypothetical protein [Bacteroidota bacterium]